AGRVRWVTSAQTAVVPFNAGRAASFPDLLLPRATAPFFLTVDDPSIGPLLGGFTPMLWAAGP
ncbi:MAG: hypothetical protein M3290_05375, partial [Actinomycetota bacterium]|nr:hypothetical protein [Actinomycetota bacterium]